jgi:hypothetical protein
MFLRLMNSSLVLSLATALPACGSLNDNTGTPSTLARLEGQVVNPQTVAVGGTAVRVAIVWQAVDGFAVAEDLPVQPVFPAAFTIDINEPPPAEAMTDAAADFGAGSVTPTAPTSANGVEGSSATGPDGTVKVQGGSSASSSDGEVAWGTVVAYLDRNGNGRLDLVPDGATGYVDQILATNESELIVYFQGTIPAAAADQLGHMPSLGYNLHAGCDVPLPVSAPGSACPALLDAGAPAPACYDQWQSITTPITLTASSDPQVNSLMCETSDDSSSSSVGATQTLPGRPTTYPDPCDPNLSCQPDGSLYFYTTCPTVQVGLCEGTSTSCTTISYARPTPVPSDWPCKA